LRGYELDVTGSGSYPVADLGTSGVEPFGSATSESVLVSGARKLVC
jgi:hypothetical protein